MGEGKNSFGTKVAVALLVALILLAYASDTGTSDGRWYSILPPLVAIILAFLTQKLMLSMASAVALGAFLSKLPGHTFEPQAWGKSVLLTGQLMFGALTDTTNLQILAFVMLILGFISVLISAGGLKALILRLQRYVRGSRSAQVMTAIMGFLVFIDDYANTMIVGATMRPLADRYHVSREKFAFLIDATSAPVAGVAIVSTWIGYEVGLFQDLSSKLNMGRDGYAMFFDALGFRFYCFLMIGFVIFNAASGFDFGPMAKAEKRASKEGLLEAPGAQPMTSKSFRMNEEDPGVRLSLLTAAIPIFVLLAMVFAGLWIDGGGLERGWFAWLSVSNWWQVISSAKNGILILAISAFAGWIVAINVAVLWAKLPPLNTLKASLMGFKGSLLPIVILVLAWSLKGVCDELHTGPFIVSMVGDSVPPVLFPAIVFVVASFTAFATGTSWGTMAILLPTLTPVAHALDGGAYGMLTPVVLAAVLDGAILGDHCSPISDTTIMSSIAASCDHLHHVQTQMPYSVLVGFLAVVCGYIPAALGVSGWLGIAFGLVVLASIFLAGTFRERVKRSRALSAT